MGLSTADLKEISYGMVTDMFVEKGIDREEQREEEQGGVRDATQEDFDRF